MKNGKQSATVFVIDGISHCVVEPLTETCLLMLQMKEVNITTVKDLIVVSWWQLQITSTVFHTLKLAKKSDGRVFQSCLLLNLWRMDSFPLEASLLGTMHWHLNPTWRHIKTVRPLTQEGSIFNYRFSRARRIIEKVFGILHSRFRFVDRKLAVKLGTVKKLVSAACALHNWLVITSKATYLSGGAIDENETGEIIPGQWRS